MSLSVVSIASRHFQRGLTLAYVLSPTVNETLGKALQFLATDALNQVYICNRP